LHEHPNKLLRVYVNKINNIALAEIFICSCTDVRVFLVDYNVAKIGAAVAGQILLKEQMLSDQVGN
jgi:hypothetical protein